MIEVYDLLFDEMNIEEMHRHGIAPFVAQQVLDNGPWIG
jgi:hypothetical protein